MKYKYMTIRDAINCEVVPALGEFADEYDVDEIALRTFRYTDGYFELRDDVDFWKVAQECFTGDAVDCEGDTEEVSERRSKADFKALRERVGLSQQDVATALGVNIKTAKNWENPKQDRYRIPADAWSYLDHALDLQKQQVSYACAVVAKQVEAFGAEPVTVPITYYRDQAMYDEFGRDSGPFGQANANARAMAYELERRGIKVEFRYPTENAISTPGSRY